MKLKVAVDVIVFSIIDDDLKVLLISRTTNPFKNYWAVPGGFVLENESLEVAAKRELREETGIKKIYLEQLYTFGDPKRDPRGRIISVSYFALLAEGEKQRIIGASGAKDAKWFSVFHSQRLAFDHEQIVKYALSRLQAKMEYTNIVYSLLPKEFTLADLQNIYEIVFSKKFDKRNFRKKILSLGVLKLTGKKVIRGVHRPAKTYKFKKQELSFVEITN